MITVLHGNCLEKLRELPEQSVHCVITSPPYWGLRDYKIPPSIWGGEPDCEHDWTDDSYVIRSNDNKGNSGTEKQYSNAGTIGRDNPIHHSFCAKCNAWRGVFGLEPTPELYLAHSLLIFSEVWRVLRDDGTFWVNLGDSYARQTGVGRQKNSSGLKAGDLVGIPWRVALALQSAGWYLRRDNIWFKPNPMPESVNGWRWEQHRLKSGKRVAVDWKATPKGWDVGEGGHDKVAGGNYRTNGEREATTAEMIDCPGCDKCAPNGGLILRKGNWRCTTSHEYVFQFSKSDSYFCDAEAARERSLPQSIARVKQKSFGAQNGGAKDYGTNGVNPNRSMRKTIENFANNPTNRNLRSVWRISTKPYKDAHFATFPPDLVRPIVRAATPVKCCGKCGAPYAPVVVRGEPRREQQLACGSDTNGRYNGTAQKDFVGAKAENASDVKARILAGMVEKRVVDHRATCKCNAASARAVVLDTFGGSGTVGQVSIEEGRSAVLIEIAEHYLPLIRKRCGVTAGLAL